MLINEKLRQINTGRTFYNYDVACDTITLSRPASDPMLMDDDDDDDEGSRN